MEKGTPQIRQNASAGHTLPRYKKNRNVLGDTFLQWGRSCSLLETALRGEAVSGALLNWGIAKTYINVLGGYD